MADEEAEQTFFQNQAMNAESMDPPESGDEETANSDAEDYDPSKSLDDQYQVTPAESEPQHHGAATDVAAVDQSASSDMPTGDTNATAMNPSLAESQTSTPVTPAGTSAQSQPKTIGGFVVDDDGEDEDEEADYEPPAALGMDDTNAIPMTMSEDPSSGNANQTTSPDVSLQPPVQASASVPDATNSSYSSAPVPNVDSSVFGQLQLASLDGGFQNTALPTSVPDSPSASRGRLAHDRVGILQDRVDEDPRGDIPAWLELIAEHRGRNRLDSVREVYERFLKLFPMAVSWCLKLSIPLTQANRCLTGRPMGGVCYNGVRTERVLPPGADFQSNSSHDSKRRIMDCLSRLCSAPESLNNRHQWTSQTGHLLSVRARCETCGHGQGEWRHLE